jgi:hypothetical protein
MSWEHICVSHDVRDVLIVILLKLDVLAELADHVLMIFVFVKSLQHLLLEVLSITD